jgi:hypothetical protein
MLLKLESLTHYQSQLLLTSFNNDYQSLLSEWDQDPDSVLAEYSFIPQGLLAGPPQLRKNTTHGFGDRVESTSLKEDVRQLEWVEADIHDIVLAQGGFFYHAMAWYLQQYREKKLVLPPTAQWCHQREKWIITDGTHRFVAAQNLSPDEKNAAHLVGDSSIVLAKTNQSLTINHVYQLNQLIVSQ